MKTKKLTLLLLLCGLNIFAFQQKDSLNYYVKLYEKVNIVDSLDNALRFFNNDKEFYLSSHLERVSYDLYYISKIEYKFGDLYNSEKTAIEGLNLLDSLPFNDKIERRKRSFYNHLGILSRDLDNYDDSINYYFKALSLCKTKRDSALAYNNISTNHIDLEEYEEAKEKLLLSAKIYKELKDSIGIALALNNLGLLQSKLYESDGLANLKNALQIRRKINDPLIYESYKYITEYYFDRKDISRAKHYAEKGYKEAIKFNSLSYKYEALLDLIKTGVSGYGKEFGEVVEKILENNDLKRNTYALAKYNIKEEKERANRNELRAIKAESDKNRSDKRAIINLSIASFILLASIFLYFLLKTRHKKEKLKTHFAAEQQISKKLHDEVANDVYSMMSRLQNDPNTKKELIDNLEEVYLKTRDISKANAAVDVSENFQELLLDLIEGYKTKDVNIFTRNISQVSWSSISNLKKETLYRVLQELMTNMKKHSKASLVTLKFEEIKGKVSVIYMDNGIGGDLKRGNGLRNTENRMEMADGKITFESETNKGFQAKLLI